LSVNYTGRIPIAEARAGRRISIGFRLCRDAGQAGENSILLQNKE